MNIYCLIVMVVRDWCLLGQGEGVVRVGRYAGCKGVGR